MEKHLDVMKQSVALLDTVIAGLKHVQQLINEGKYEDAILLFENTVHGFSTVEKSLVGLTENILPPESKKLENNVRNAILYVVQAFETKSYGKVQEILQFTLIPQYNKWKLTLEHIFQPYVIL